MSESSRLVQMEIRNIGCIGNDGLTILLDDIVCLVGANNTGKSTVLRAYEAAVSQQQLDRDELNLGANGEPAIVELWAHIPDSAGNIDKKWKEAKGDLLLVRSRWTWPINGGKPVRTTWDPSINGFAEDGKASGLDTVFNSRLPKPFRIGSLDSPDEEHKKLLALVLEPVISKLKAQMDDKDSALSTKISELRTEAEKPVEEFKEDLATVESQVNTSYQRVFSAAKINITVSLGELGIDPSKSLTSASRVDITESHGTTRWNQQGTGSQRALFWSMLQARSDLLRLSEDRKQRDKKISSLEKDIQKNEKKLGTVQTQAKKDECQATIDKLKGQLVSHREHSGEGQNDPADPFLPGYMLLIDEPETALHPAAVRAAKEHLYTLASGSGWQVMLTTHHPVFVDPLEDHTTIVRLQRPDLHLDPNMYRSRDAQFSSDELDNLKSLLSFDSSVAEIFFGSRVIIVEGDTEFAAFIEIMAQDASSFPIDRRPLIVRARGKATIPPLVKMLQHFRLDFAVLHDIDSPMSKDGERKNPAYSTNSQISATIKAARDSGIQITHRVSCPDFEHQHGMSLPYKDKPYHSWKAVNESEGIRASVRSVLEELLSTGNSEPLDDPSDGQNFEALVRSWASSHAKDNPRYNFA